MSSLFPRAPQSPGVRRWGIYGGRGAIRITGSPFKIFDEAEAACDAMLNT
jgi:hypothetical protein